MVYTIYETNCIIFDLKNMREDDVLIKAFSDKFGIISIIATSFRKSNAKLKGNIKAFSVNKIAVVRGKEFFRLTDVSHMFAFAGSKSLVQFLRLAESLFFNDERDYFDEVNTQIYNMIIHMCKFIIYIIKREAMEGRKEKKFYLELVNIFFTVYVRGLQGFVGKIDIDDMLKLEGESMCVWFERESMGIQSFHKKLGF